MYDTENQQEMLTKFCKAVITLKMISCQVHDATILFKIINLTIC